MTRILVLTIVSTILLAGCLGSTDVLDPAAVQPEPEAAPPSHVLTGTLEPGDLTAPAFELLGAVAKGGPVYGAGEPGIWAHLDGTLYVTFPGCDQGFYLVRVPTQPTCQHGIIFKSNDSGKTWQRLNADGTGRLTSDGPAANGDADITVDAAGVVYASNLGGGGIQFHRSLDGGLTWEYMANVVPEGHWADRQWMAAAGPGHVIEAWMGGEGSQRAVAVTTTRDGGATWSPVEYLGERIGWIGPVQFDPAGERAYIPFTQRAGGALGSPSTFDLLVARTLDGGATWDVVETGVQTKASATGGHWSGVLMAPALDVTGDGHVVYAWSEEVMDPAGVNYIGAKVRYVTSGDGGETWSAPVDVSKVPQAIMPWVVGGAGDRFAVTYFSSGIPANTDYTGRWDLTAVVVDSAANATPQMVTTVVDKDIHLGGICSKGGGCFTSGSDRALLDYFEADLMPDGRLVIVYPSDPLQGGKYIEIRVAIQNGGTPLLALPAVAEEAAEAEPEGAEA